MQFLKRLDNNELKKELRRVEHEHTLLINEEGDLELAEWSMQDFSLLDGVSVFLLERRGAAYAVIWDNLGEGVLSLDDCEISVFERLGGEDIAVRRNGVLSADMGRKRFLCAADRERLVGALCRAVYRRLK